MSLSIVKFGEPSSEGQSCHRTKIYNELMFTEDTYQRHLNLIVKVPIFIHMLPQFFMSKMF